MWTPDRARVKERNDPGDVNAPLFYRLAVSVGHACAERSASRRGAKEIPALLPIYRDLHAHPELSMQETKTSAKLAAEARKLGFKVTENVGKTGVVAIMENGPGPVLLIRADMDGLPVSEQTRLSFGSFDPHIFDRLSQVGR